MDLRVQRHPAVDGVLPGELWIDGQRFSFSAENAAKAIPAGRYVVALTVSQRSLDGELWSPDPDHRLPLLCNVPGRTGIRMHALNEAQHEAAGCIGVGRSLTGSWLGQSRDALKALVPVLDATLSRFENVWITVVDPPKLGGGTKRA